MLQGHLSDVTLCWIYIELVNKMMQKILSNYMFKGNSRNMVPIVISGLLSLRVQEAENLSEIFRKISKG